MAAYNSIDLGRLALVPGGGRRLDVAAEINEIELAGERYAFVPKPVPVRLEVSRTAAGHAMRLAFSGELTGPCMRCLADARVPVEVEAREIDQPGAGDEELTSPYVEEEELDLTSWARDALALALPQQLVCRPDCAGLCPVCGASLNDADPDDHRHRTGGDPRWAKLRELNLE